MEQIWKGSDELDGPKVNAMGKGFESAIGKIRIKAGKLIVKGMVLAKDLGYITDLERIVFFNTAKSKAEFHFKGRIIWKIKEQKKGELERFTQELQKGLEGLPVTHEVKKTNTGKIVKYAIGAFVFLALLSAIFSDPDKRSGSASAVTSTKQVQKNAGMPNIVPQYKLVKRDSDSNYANVVRKGIRITIPKGLDRKTVKANLEHAAWTVHKESKPDAVMVFAYHPGDDINSSYSVGRCVLAPNGKWEDAGSDGSMKTTVDLIGSFEKPVIETPRKVKPVTPPKPAPVKKEVKKSPSSGATRTTKGGYVASTSIDKLDKAVEYVVQGDKVAFDTFINQNTDVIILKSGIEVFITDTKILGGQVKIRPKGQTFELWTSLEAVE